MDAYKSILLPKIIALVLFGILGSLLLTMNQHDLMEHEQEFSSDVELAKEKVKAHLTRAFLEILRLKEFFSNGDNRINDNKEILAEYGFDFDFVFLLPAEEVDADFKDAKVAVIPLFGDKLQLNTRANQNSSPLSDAAFASKYDKENNYIDSLVFIVPFTTRDVVAGYKVDYLAAGYFCQDFFERFIPESLLVDNSFNIFPHGSRYSCESSVKSTIPKSLEKSFDINIVDSAWKMNIEGHQTSFMHGYGIAVVTLCSALIFCVVYATSKLITQSDKLNKSREHLKTERDNFLNVLSNMKDGVAIISSGLDIIYLNHALKKEFGECENRKCFEYFHGNKVPCEWCFIKEVLDGKTVHSEWCYPQNGKTYDLIDSRIVNSDGTVLKLKIFRDISERIVIEKAEKARAENVQIRLRENKSLQRITSALLDKTNLDEILDIVCQESHKLSGADFTGVFLSDEDGLILKNQKGLQQSSTLVLDINDSLTGLALKKNSPVLISEDSLPERPHYMTPHPDEIYTIPISTKGNAIGALEVIKVSGRLKKDNLGLLVSYAHQGAIAIENARLRQKEGKLAIIEERQRIARELHDSVNQSIYSASLYAEACLQGELLKDNSKAKSHIGNIQELTSEALNEMRMLIFQLQPPFSEREGLLEALDTRLAAVKSRTGIFTELLASKDFEKCLDRETQLSVYRFIQEALNNVIKHSSAKNIRVQMISEKGVIKIAITDDGVGFDPQSVKGNKRCMGLKNMLERINQHGGTVWWDSAHNKGTTVIAKLPLAKRADYNV